MSGYAIHKKKFFSLCLHPMIWALLILLTAGCGDNPSSAENTTADTSRTGSASFSVQWQPNNTVSASTDGITKYAIDCSAVGIESITCRVYDENNDPVASGGPWTCADGGARMDRIPAGSDLTFTILGWDTEDGNIIYQGSSEIPVTIISGETTDAGTIKANPFVPTGLGAHAVSTSQIDLTWNDIGASSYRIYQDGNIVATPTSPSFPITDLTQSTEYCYTVSAVDVFGNESGQSNEDCATTGSENDTQAPTVPTSLNAVAVSASRIDISWVESTDNVGVSGYRIYDLDGQLVGTTTEPSFSHEGLQADFQYCYTVEAFDATGNPSALSAEDCATTQASTDTEPPTQPQELEAVAVTAGQIDLSWTPSTDNIGVSRYRVYRDGQEVGTATSTSFSDEGLEPDTPYCYTIEAYDAAGNVSQASSEICSTTLSLYVWYRDFDQDTFGDPAVSITATTQPTGYIEDNTDCDDAIDTIYPGAREVCNGRDDNCNKQIDDNCTSNLSASFTTRLIVNDGVLMGDAKDQEGLPFNSNTLFVDGPNSDRVSLEFDIRYPIGGTAILQFEMINTNAPDSPFYGDLYSYPANGLANGRDYFETQSHQHLEIFSDNRQTGRHTYRFDVTKAFLEFNASEQQYMGISIRPIDTNARCEITNPILTVTQN